MHKAAFLLAVVPRSAEAESNETIAAMRSGVVMGSMGSPKGWADSSTRCVVVQGAGGQQGFSS